MEGPIEVAECDETQEHFVYHTWHCSAMRGSFVTEDYAIIFRWCFTIMLRIISIF